MTSRRDHGGGLDAAIARWGGTRADWLDLSTGINPEPYPPGRISRDAWTALPDTGAQDRLLAAARRFWQVPDGAAIVAAPGTSALIARLPELSGFAAVHIPGPTYNEHAAAFRARRHIVDAGNASLPVHVYVHPNNPDGRLWPGSALGGRPVTIVDESFCDVAPEASHISRTSEPGIVVLKSFGKFWGLAGLRLGFAIGRPETFAPPAPPGSADRGGGAPGACLTDLLGPWAVSGPALEIGARALEDDAWAAATRARLARDAARLDALMAVAGAGLVGGTTLFRLYDTPDAQEWQARLAQARIWSRVFPYSDRWLRLGLPPAAGWDRLAAAVAR